MDGLRLAIKRESGGKGKVVRGAKHFDGITRSSATPRRATERPRFDTSAVKELEVT
jgi:hypothetical protein